MCACSSSLATKVGAKRLINLAAYSSTIWSSYCLFYELLSHLLLCRFMEKSSMKYLSKVLPGEMFLVPYLLGHPSCSGHKGIECTQCTQPLRDSPLEFLSPSKDSPYQQFIIWPLMVLSLQKPLMAVISKSQTSSCSFLVPRTVTFLRTTLSSSIMSVLLLAPDS